MKATAKFLSLILLFASTSLWAGNWQHNEEEYIDDIPFNTKAIFDSVQASRMAAEFRPAEEAYIDDIPFDTRKIASISLAEQALNTPFNMPEEPYINDIPFNTRVIASRYMYRSTASLSVGMIKYVLIR
jgi:hypothetical protein